MMTVFVAKHVQNVLMVQELANAFDAPTIYVLNAQILPAHGEDRWNPRGLNRVSAP
jgi:hypothetical protein